LEENLKDNENLRWMIFKVKQRSQADYYDFLATQLGKVPATIGQRSEAPGTDFKLMYNWPYDFLSFVEKIKIDAQIIYREDHEILVDRDELEKSKQIDWAKAQSNIKATKYMANGAAPNQQVAVGIEPLKKATGTTTDIATYQSTIDTSAPEITYREVATNIFSPILSQEAYNRLKDK
jgi:hypothetical protein